MSGRQAIVRHDVDEKTAQHERPDALHQKLLSRCVPGCRPRLERTDMADSKTAHGTPRG